MNGDPGGNDESIVALDRLVAALPAGDRERLERIFQIDCTTGETRAPEAMHAWLERQFGSVDAVCRQRIVKVTNRYTLEGALFNELRTSRPSEAPAEMRNVEREIEAAAGDPFCQPEEKTPADLFGRLRSEHASTASNVAKFDGWHAVIIFDEHHPLRFSREQVADYVDIGQEWARKAHEAEPLARYPFFLWNCLWRSGASIIHGHAQMTLTRKMHYARVENWRRAALQYRHEYGSDYFADLIATHDSLGLAIEHGTATILPSLTPFKEKETHIIGADLGADMKSALYRVLRAFVDRLGVQSFNVALYQPPLTPTAEDWTGVPFVFRLLDRGSVESNASDLGAMDIFGQSVVSTDPYHIAAELVHAGELAG